MSRMERMVLNVSGPADLHKLDKLLSEPEPAGDDPEPTAARAARHDGAGWPDAEVQRQGKGT